MKLRLTIILIFSLSVSGCAVGPKGLGGHRGHHGGLGFLALGAGIAIGTVLTSLPHRHTLVAEKTYYSDGVYYKSSPSGYTVVTPAVGIWVDDIPKKHRVLRHEKHDYFISKGVWYRFDVTRKRYQVVKKPITYKGR